MILKEDEYIVSKNVPDESITIIKAALVEWRDHYHEVAKEKKKDALFLRSFYLGKVDVLTDILKHFEREEAKLSQLKNV